MDHNPTDTLERHAPRAERFRTIRLHGNVVDDMPIVDLQPFPAGIFQPVTVQPEQMEDRGVEIGDIILLAKLIIPKFVGRAADIPWLDPAANTSFPETLTN